MNRILLLMAICILFSFSIVLNAVEKKEEQAIPKAFEQAMENGRLANAGFKCCLNFVKAWLKHADPKTGLIPRNLKKEFSGPTKIEPDEYWNQNYWNAQDCAADNYPFMVLTTYFTGHSLFNIRMLNMLQTEKKLTSRIGTLPDTYSFSKQDFFYSELDINRIMFGASEYIKDGLIALTEWLGQSPWSERMIEMLDDMWKYAPIETKHGKIVSTNIEVNGEMLQVLSRIYWMTGDQKYLDWAIRLGDYYFLDRHHPTRDLKRLRLRNHGCEIISGLCELYATLHFAMPEKKRVYKRPLHTMLKRILEVGRNEHGLFYNEINPKTGEILDRGIVDTWGYPLNGYYTVYLLDGIQQYFDAILKAMSSLNNHYRNFKWEKESADGYADAIESALNLFNRQPLLSVAEWIDSEIEVMWNKQQPNGMVEGWHSDGNFARTTIMYCLWKIQGITIRPWREDVIYGAVMENGSLKIALFAEKAWSGKIIFDKQRHKINMKLPLDWPRINQFPEWFTVKAANTYSIFNLSTGSKKLYSGEELQKGINLSLQPKARHYFRIQ